MKAKSEKQIKKNTKKTTLKKTTALHEAALDGDLLSVIELEKNEKEFNKQLHFVDHNYDLPLDRACPRGHYEIVKILLMAHKKPGNDYVMYNPQNYSPFLSAVRWYLKVLDNATRHLRVGVFNTGKNCSEDYIKIIRLLAEELPSMLSNKDNKQLNALDYAVMHFYNAKMEENKSVEKIIKIKALIEILIGFNLPINLHNSLPVIWDKVGCVINRMQQTHIEKTNTHTHFKENNAVSVETNKGLEVKNDLMSQETLPGEVSVSTLTSPGFFKPFNKSCDEQIYDSYMNALGI